MLNTLKGLLFLLSLRLINGYPQINNPVAGASINGGAVFTVAWEESGDPPLINDLNSYELFLYTGTDANPQQLYSLKNGAFVTGKSVSVTIPVGTGGSMKNAYFLGLVSSATKGGTVTSFSERFTLTGMKGSLPVAVKAALDKISSNSRPKVVIKVAAAATPDLLDGGLWDIPYNLQTGLTKYAPMQPIPPTAITATKTEALWPTSSVEFAKTLMPIPIQVTTMTQSQTFSVSSHANTVGRLNLYTL